MASLSPKLKDSIEGFYQKLSDPLANPLVSETDTTIGLEMIDALEMPDELEMI